MNNGKIAICRSGGGLDGLDIHAGIFAALKDYQVSGDVLMGTSAGAVASAADAAGWDASKFGQAIADLQDADVRDPHTLWPLRLAWVPSIWAGDKVQALLRKLFPESWPEAIKDWRVLPNLFATRIGDAASVDVCGSFRAKSPADAIYASLAVPCIFPAYAFGGAAYRDGGIRRNLPLPGNWRMYERVYLCIATGKRRKYENKNDCLSQALSLFGQFCDDSILDVLEETHGAPNVTVIWPEPDSRGGMLHFDHALAEKAYDLAMAALRGETSQSAVRCAGVAALSR